ncbi:Zinc/iron permease [Gilbertella persicaria]|uniref:Zinc transporter n=1 Tax=Rhizopus stolonifer TaxID=4846 RepID=A0A367J870_RHIST|nr:Zinc/iron permease [Gilbertella persicaria]KAI8075466.1 Zinc/iron permease [Gilbertella persicaria]RCH86110.1 hypothetical protein CU098_007987 [Rhizopus stolonifer]
MIEEGWLMVLVSSLACISGASIVFLGRQILENQHFLSASMALGGGVLVFNSLYTLLPASQQKLNSDFYMFLCFFIGVIFTVCLTRFIQWCTPHAIHTCDSLSNTDSSKPLFSHQHHHHEERGYGSMVIHSDHSTERADYFLIGVQTAIAICIHKFPEGLIMFISNKSSSQLGLSVAAAISIHNFIEGFLIALPLFYATGSRLSAFTYASFLGGLSQPLGAMIGLLVIHNKDQFQEQFLFGIIFGIVSGMMCYIAIQSMIPQAVRSDASHQCVPLFFFIGIFLVGLSSLLHSI